jgi:hypothetical protein
VRPALQRRLRVLDAEGEGAANVTLGQAARAAREEAITLPLTGDLQMLHLGELFPTFPGGFGATQVLSEGGGASGGRPCSSTVSAAAGGGQAGGALVAVNTLLSLHSSHPRCALSLTLGPMQLGDGLFVMPSLPDGPSPSDGGVRQRAGKGRRGAGASAGDAAGHPGGGLLLAAGDEAEVELNLAGLPRHDLELM